MRIQAYQNNYGHIDFRICKKYDGELCTFDANLYLQAGSDIDCFLGYLPIWEKEEISEQWIDVNVNNPFFDYILEVNKMS